MSTLEPEEPAAPAVPTGTGEALSAEQAVLDELEALVDPLEGALDMDPLDNHRRMLVVHAHPDDETIECGATMAHYAADGVLVSLVTCTRGEEGEVVSDVADRLGHLTADRDDALGEHRVEELAAAMEALGVDDHRFLGERAGHRYRDSGMAGTDSTLRPECLVNADRDQLVDELIAVIRELRPQVVVAPAQDGGYGHPDHIAANRIALAAVRLADDADRAPELGEPWAVSSVFTTMQPRSALARRTAELRSMQHPYEVVEVDQLGFAVEDEQADTAIDARDALDAQLAGLRAHATQVRVHGRCFALSNDIARLADGVEHYRRVRGAAGPGRDGEGRENDLFGGLG